jgi:site-specific recombinase XerD
VSGVTERDLLTPLPLTSLPSAQRLAGHRQIATTQRYLGTSDAELKAFYKKHVD